MYWITSGSVVVNCNSIPHEKCFVLHSFLVVWLVKGTTFTGGQTWLDLPLWTYSHLCHCAICAVLFVWTTGINFALCVCTPLCASLERQHYLSHCATVPFTILCAPVVIYSLVCHCTTTSPSSTSMCATVLLYVPVVPPCVPLCHYVSQYNLHVRHCTSICPGSAYLCAQVVPPGVSQYYLHVRYCTTICPSSTSLCATVPLCVPV